LIWPDQGAKRQQIRAVVQGNLNAALMLSSACPGFIAGGPSLKSIQPAQDLIAVSASAPYARAVFHRPEPA
jgi:hypothetical protein